MTVKSVSDRVKFIQTERLCFGYLNSGHMSKICDSRSVCNTCNKRHPTCLLEDRDNVQQRTPQAKVENTSQEKNNDKLQVTQAKDTTTVVTSNRIILDDPSTQTFAVLPVRLSSVTQPAREVLVYALLDSQSDTTFVLREVVDTLANKEQVKLKLSTMASKTTVINK